MTIKIEKLHFFLRLAVIFILAGLFLFIFTPFAVPILMAAFFAFGCEPLLQKIHVKSQFKTKRRRYFTLGLFVTLLIVILVPVVAFILRVLKGLKSISAESMQNSQLFQSLFNLWEKLQTFIMAAVRTLGLDLDSIPQKDELFGKISPIILDKATLFLGSLPDLILSTFVFFCMLVLFVLNAAKIKTYVLSIRLLPEFETNLITKSLQDSCSMILISTLLIGALQAFIVAIGSSLFGYHEFFLIFLVTFFLSFIPVIGAAPVAALLALISFLTGNSGDGVGLIVVTVIAGSVDNILKPFVFSRAEANMHPLVSLLGIIGAIIVFGLPGLLLGPLLLQITIYLVPRITSRLLS